MYVHGEPSRRVSFVCLSPRRGSSARDSPHDSQKDRPQQFVTRSSDASHVYYGSERVVHILSCIILPLHFHYFHFFVRFIILPLQHGCLAATAIELSATKPRLVLRPEEYFIAHRRFFLFFFSLNLLLFPEERSIVAQTA